MHNIAQNIITKFGGHESIAEILGVDVTRVYRWTYPKTRGGTDGLIPQSHHHNLMRAAIKHGIDLNPSDFFDLPKAGTPKIKKS